MLHLNKSTIYKLVKLTQEADLLFRLFQHELVHHVIAKDHKLFSIPCIFLKI